jgi:hypothetical protein
MQNKRAGELQRRDAAPAVDLLQALKRTAASFSPRRLSGRHTAPVRGTLREDLGVPYVGVVRASRQGLRWHRRWALGEQAVGWNQVRSCTVSTDRRPGVPRHTHRLMLEHNQGLLEVILRDREGLWPLWGCETGSAPGHTYSMVAARTATADPNQLNRQERSSSPGDALVGLGWSHGLLPAHRHSDTPLPHFEPHHWGGEGRQPTGGLASWAKAEKRS